MNETQFSKSVVGAEKYVSFICLMKIIIFLREYNYFYNIMFNMPKKHCIQGSFGHFSLYLGTFYMQFNLVRKIDIFTNIFRNS